MKRLDCFKAHVVRGWVPEELDEELAYKIGRADVAFLNQGGCPWARDLRLALGRGPGRQPYGERGGDP
jgi:hypothetical protein